MHLTVSKQFFFDAAHHLPNHAGKCKNPHGHTYKLEVELSYEGSYSPDRNRVFELGWTILYDPNTPNSSEGMLFDFGEIKRIVHQEVISKYDHQNLNDFFPITTCEYMVVEMHRALSAAFLDSLGAKLVRTTLAEVCLPTESKATVYED